ncbi:hypothetical protein [Candidatus Vidania fulgoroideorum]
MILKTKKSIINNNIYGKLTFYSDKKSDKFIKKIGNKYSINSLNYKKKNIRKIFLTFK